MIYSLKGYQRGAVDGLKGYFEFYLNKENKTIVFKAPTGSGKTFMVASLIEELVEEINDYDFCIIWASIGKGELQKQSYESVKTYLGGNPICSLLEDTYFGSRKYIKNHEIVFVNWEKLVSKDKSTGKWINNLMKDQESQNFINVIDQTKQNGTKIILVVDESHIGANSASRITEFKEQIIIPDITFEMSATPLVKPDVEVDIEHVISEGMIKKEVIVNEGIKQDLIPEPDLDSELIVLTKAEEKRKELLVEYKNLNSKVNPLVLVQIPNVEEGEAKKLVIKDFLRKLDITEENGKLKLWCDDKGNFDKKAIKNIDNETEYLIFKTAVATGWDCPRAQILVKFREGKSETFEIQTIGRILRTAEAKTYDNYLLDNAYIFTNIKEFETKQDTYNPNKIKTEFSYFREKFNYKNKQDVYEITKLKSFYRSREGNYNSADSRFNEYFEKEFMNFFGFNESDKKNSDSNETIFSSKNFILNININDFMIEETVIRASSVDQSQTISGGNAEVRMSENDIQASYYSIIKDNLNGLAYIRSKSPINMAIIDVFSKFNNNFERSEKVLKIQKIFLKNAKIFAQILTRATLNFRNMLQENAHKKGKTYDFKIEEKRGYSLETHKEFTCNKSLYKPFYVPFEKEADRTNQLEDDFLRYLDSSDFVLWYWENGTELMEINFGISYNNGMNTFQPDFIVKFEDGTIGIFDTKPIGYRIEDTKLKSEALHRYLIDININRGYAPKVIGGIVVKKGNQFFVYDEKEYIDFNSNNEKWKNFEGIFDKVDRTCKLINNGRK